MRLTSFTDYSLRVLMYVGVKGEGLATIDEIASRYGISRNHLMKVVLRLGQLGYLKTVRGKGGGLRLAQPPEAINLGAVVRATEDDLGLVECLQKPERGSGAGPAGGCRIAPACVLRGVLGEALDAFLAVLDRYTLADLIRPRAPLADLLGITEPA